MSDDSTTIQVKQFPTKLWREARVRAAAHNTTVRQILIDALAAYLAASVSEAK